MNAVYEGEEGYLRLARDIIDNGVERRDRTGTGTRSIFAPPKLVFRDVGQRFPILTTKRVFWRGVLHELLWFLRGSTNSKDLEKHGVNIWRDNTTRQFLDKCGLSSYPEGEAGPIYGHQWRAWGSVHPSVDTTGKMLSLIILVGFLYNALLLIFCGGENLVQCILLACAAIAFRLHTKNQGIDQLSQAIETIRLDPFSRRIVVSAWNVSDLEHMALPPCHMYYQFYVRSDGKTLDLIVYMRSCDVALGLPFNIASYAALLCIVANITDKTPGDLHMMLGDAHVYLNHVEQLKMQTEREIAADVCPRLVIKHTLDDIDDIEFEDFELVNYKHQPPINFAMNA